MNKTDKILALFKTNPVDEFGLPLTHSEIARLVYCTSELVRRVVGNAGGKELYYLKLKKRREKEFNQRKLICKPSSFVRFINKWLSTYLGEKYCNKCNKVKCLKDYSIAYFYKNKPQHQSKCKDCASKASSFWFSKNRERRNELQREYYRRKKAK